jgi:hypothetical protein
MTALQSHALRQALLPCSRFLPFDARPFVRTHGLITGKLISCKRLNRSSHHCVRSLHDAAAPPPATSAYVHLPFCKRKCFYCDFPVLAVGSHAHSPRTQDRMQAYVDLLCKEIARTPTAGPPAPLETIFFGGGTPSLCPTPLVAQILEHLSLKFGIAAGAEISLEADPGTFGPEQLQEYRRLGVNRLSVGVQCFDDGLLAKCGRSHSLGDVYRAIEDVQGSGVPTWSLDLISGLPHLDLEIWRHSLEECIKAAPPHVSVYDLQVEEGTPFARCVLGQPGGAACRLVEAACCGLARHAWGPMLACRGNPVAAQDGILPSVSAITAVRHPRMHSHLSMKCVLLPAGGTRRAPGLFPRTTMLQRCTPWRRACCGGRGMSTTRSAATRSQATAACTTRSTGRWVPACSLTLVLVSGCTCHITSLLMLLRQMRLRFGLFLLLLERALQPSVHERDGHLYFTHAVSDLLLFKSRSAVGTQQSTRHRQPMLYHHNVRPWHAVCQSCWCGQSYM